MASDRAHTPAAPSSLAPSLVGVRILVIDDEPSLLKLLQKLLTRHGALVLTAGSSRDARAMITQHPFDLLICDHNLADGNATEMLPVLLEHQPKARVLLCSGEPVHHPGCHFLAKPFCAEDLMLAVRAALQVATY
jgi:two-component system, NtrC family, response regulator